MDFYSNNPASTLPTEGLKPIFKAQFSFEIEINETLINYLENDSFVFEINICIGENLYKIGSCKQPLLPLF